MLCRAGDITTPRHIVMRNSRFRSILCMMFTSLPHLFEGTFRVLPMDILARTASKFVVVKIFGIVRVPNNKPCAEGTSMT